MILGAYTGGQQNDRQELADVHAFPSFDIL